MYDGGKRPVMSRNIQWDSLRLCFALYMLLFHKVAGGPA